MSNQARNTLLQGTCAMPTNSAEVAAWPELPSPAEWEATLTTVHMYTQVVGKIRLALSPWVNHSWGSTLYVTTRGLTTSPIPSHEGTFSIDFDFIDHALSITTSAGRERGFALHDAMPVADFYDQTMKALSDLGVEVRIFTRPVEVVEAIRFEEDHKHSTYDAVTINRYWQALVKADQVFKAFRARFCGKVSPVHFFWGAFDLAVTRFSGREAPPHPGGAPNCADWVMKEAYSHELASAGFWPGTDQTGPAFYAYAYPAPDGYVNAKLPSVAAFYSPTLGEFILPYETVRTSSKPWETLLTFLESTYDLAADLANWNRDALDYHEKRGKV